MNGQANHVMDGTRRWLIASLVCVATLVALASSAFASDTAIRQKLENPDTGHPPGDMGVSVAVDGDTMVLGAPETNSSGLSEAGSVYVYTRDGSGFWTLQAELITSDPLKDARFGRKVAISGDTIVVLGREWLQPERRWTNVVFVFTRSGLVWTQEQKLTSDIPGENYYGDRSLAVSGDTVAVGVNAEVGATVHVFTRLGSTWTLQQKLLGAPPNASNRFGASVSLSGDTIVVGASHCDDYGVDAGSAYVFTRTGSVWSQQQQLIDITPSAGVEFGDRVAISGDTVAVRSIYENSERRYMLGSTCIFTRTGSTWTGQQEIENVDPNTRGTWGVSLSGDTLAMGAFSWGENPFSDNELRVFTRDGTTWTQTLTLSNPTERYDDAFANSFAVTSDTIAIGANGYDYGIGAAYAFVRSGSTWLQQQAITSKGEYAHGDGFGRAVAISGDTAVVGVSNDDIDGSYSAGSTYVFARSGDIWATKQKLNIVGTPEYAYFGRSVAMSSDTIVIGASGFSPEGEESSIGAVFVYVRDGETWRQQQQLMANNWSAREYAGRAVSISGDTIALGIPGADRAGVEDAGAVDVFTRAGGVWTWQANLIAPDPIENEDFGSAMSVSSDTIVVGRARQGTAEVYTRLGTTWTWRQTLTTSDTATYTGFGSDVSISGDTIIVGAYWDHGVGAAYIFERTGSTWEFAQKIFDPNGDGGDSWGGTVAISGNMIVVGGYNARVGASYGAGVAHAFGRTGSGWTLLRELLPMDHDEYDHFGLGVATDGRRAIVGSGNDDAPEYYEGSAYIFQVGPTDGARHLLAY